MHVYIYDSFLQASKYNGILAKIETRITDLGLNGKIIRLGAMKNFYNAVWEEIKKGAKTVTAVGNNQTINSLINAVAGSSIPVGFIPVGENNSLAASLGIENEESACDILAARRIEKLDAGLANNHLFLSYAAISSQGIILEINNGCFLEIAEKGEINIINLPVKNSRQIEGKKSEPQDGILELIISTRSGKKIFPQKNENQSFFPITSLMITNKDKFLIIDEAKKIATPAFINVAPQKIEIIVGKNRTF